MASKHGPVSNISSDGLAAGLVILTEESVPIEISREGHTSIQASLEQADRTQRLKHDEEDHAQDDVDFSAAVENHGVTMVSALSHIGGHLEEPDRIDETAIVRWLQDILVEDDYGKIDCKVMIDLIQKEFGSKRRKTRAWLKRAFPKSYLRRSDRNRWFCGVSFRADQGKSVISIKDKEWIDKAVSWLTSSMEMNPTAKERCSDVHHALTQYIGQASVHMAISAVKMVFPNIPRKTFSRIAFYVGIRFKDPTLGHVSIQSAANTLNSLSDIKTEYSDSAANKLIVAWLQKTLVADQTKREHIKLIGLMIKKRFGRTLPQAKVARLVKKVFPNVNLRLKGSASGIIWGVRIEDAFRPTNRWMQKSIAWLRELYEPAEASYCENATLLFDLLSQKLGIETQSKAFSLLQEAFPNMQYKEIMDCQMVFGIKQKNNADDITFPEFTDEEMSINDEIFLCLDSNSMVNEPSDRRSFDEQIPEPFYETSVPSTQAPLSSLTLHSRDSELQQKSTSSLDSKISVIEQNLKNFQETTQDELSKISTKFSQLETNMSVMMKDMSDIKDEINKLIKDNTKSVQQKDSLIIQLQQTLIMLCQQQLQKFIPGDQNFPEQALSTLLQKGLMNQGDSTDS